MVLVQQESKENKMCRLSKEQLDTKLVFIDNYIKASNAAQGSTFDSNSNVINKNVATLLAEVNKDINIQIERGLVCKYMEDIFDKSLANSYIYQLEHHDIYCHDETYPFAPYCAAVSIYPFLENGLKAFGGETKAPKHLSSFNGGFVNLIFALSSQFCGAIATVEYLTCFDHFARMEYGDDYLETHESIIKQELQQVVYALNQPASARGAQSCFWNISIFDQYYWKALFNTFYFPDGGQANWDTTNKLQQYFLKWFNEERTKALLTFPVITVSLLNDNKKVMDKEYESIVCKELSEGNGFFVYTSPTVDSLSSCCRLRNNISDQLNDFSYSLGAGGVMTGSMNVITLNINRFIKNVLAGIKAKATDKWDIIKEALEKQIYTIHKYQLAFKTMYKDLESAGMLPAYTAGYINLDKQYLTIGINGLLEAMETLGYIPSNNKKYKDRVNWFLKIISDCNRKTCANVPGLKLNTELVPAEGLGVKNAKWDKKTFGNSIKRSCYNSYLFPVEDENLTILDKIAMHGKNTTSGLDGGSALHLQLENYPTEEAYKKLLAVVVKEGCNYFCTNVKVTCCEECGYIDKNTLTACSKCGSTKVSYATRVIGYLRKINNFSEGRQIEEAKRYYHKI